MTAIRQVLAAAGCPETVGRLEELLLSASRLALERVRSGVEALARATRRRFELILTEFPLVELDMEYFLCHLRAPDSTSKEAPLVVLTGSIDRLALEALGAERLAGVDICTNSSEALQAVTRSLNLGDRLCAELRVTIVGATKGFRGPQLVRTRNISPTGMLLGAEHLLPVGTVAPISLELSSGQPLIHGRAEVVRHADPTREQVSGMGMRFVDLFDGGGRRLTDFVTDELLIQRSAEPRPGGGPTS